MSTGLYTNQFSEIFSKLLEKSRVSCYQISQFTYIDQAYLSRLKSGERENPSPEIVMKIAIALARFSPKISISDIEDLFNATGRSINAR